MGQQKLACSSDPAHSLVTKLLNKTVAVVYKAFTLESVHKSAFCDRYLQ